MTASRVRAAAFFLAALVVAQSQAASAQSEQPQQLLPTFLQPGRDLTNQSDVGARSVIGGGQIEINRVGTTAVDSVGVLQAGDGGFGPATWTGSQRAEIESLLALLPADFGSRELRALARRLLLSAAPPPRGTALGGQSDGQAGGFLSLRAASLEWIGEYGGLRELLVRVPRRADNDPGLLRQRFEMALVAGATQDACGRAFDGVARYSEDADWQRAMIYCHFAAGETDAAALGLDLLREAGEQDSDFVALANVLLGLAEMPERVAPSPLNLAMIELAGRPPPRATVEAADPGLRAWLSTWTSLDDDLRLNLTEDAAARGLVPAGELATAYRVTRFEQAQLDDALAAASYMTAPPGRALLYRAAAEGTWVRQRAELLQALSDLSRGGELEMAVSEASMPLLAVLPVDENQLDLAATAARLSLLADQSERAAGWLDLVRRQPGTAVETKRDFLALWPFARMTDNWLDMRGVSVAHWGDLARELGRDPAAVAGQQAFLEAVLPVTDQINSGLSESLTPVRTAAASDAGGSAIFRDLREAAQQGRTGETVLRALLFLAEGGLASSEPELLAEVMLALDQVGLGASARRLALEAAVQRGL
jgi:hypothetical protein